MITDCEESYLTNNWVFGMTCSSLAALRILKLSADGEGFSVNAFTIPAGNDIIKLPVVFTAHLKCHQSAHT